MSPCVLFSLVSEFRSRVQHLEVAVLRFLRRFILLDFIYNAAVDGRCPKETECSETFEQFCVLYSCALLMQDK